MPSFGIPDLSPELEADLVSRMAQVEVLLRKQIDGKYPLVVETSRHLVEAGGKRHPLGRVGESSDIANLTVFLLSPANSWITGQIIGVDGGMGSLKPA